MSYLRESIDQKKKELELLLRTPVLRIAVECAKQWAHPEEIASILSRSIHQIPPCSLLYVIDESGHQVGASVGSDITHPEHTGRNLSERPYLKRVESIADTALSELYVSQTGGHLCVTMLQPIFEEGRKLGYLAADFDLRDMRLSGSPPFANPDYRQLKGDPAIRATVFQQQRVRSEMDLHMHEVMTLIEELIRERGVFHAKIHFSSSRVTLWHMDDPYSYHLHVIEELLDPSLLLSYPPQSYPLRATVDAQRIRQTLDLFMKLREVDEVIYLRSGSINIINGLVGLTFSCDGSHYMRADDFVERGLDFWLG
jgi:hypothetical protein